MNVLSTKMLRSAPRSVVVASQRALDQILLVRSMHTSFPNHFTGANDDGLCFHDHDHPANQFGYRVATSSHRQSSTMSIVDPPPLSHDVYNHSSPPVPPESLDILNSPQVREILESQREWDATLREEQTAVWAMEEEEQTDVIDPYLSDYEAMNWEVEPSLDEKPM